MTLHRLTEHRDITQWEPAEGESVPVQIRYLGRAALLHVDRVTVTRVKYAENGTQSHESVDVSFRTRGNGARFGQWAWHSSQHEGREILGEVTDPRVWSLLKAEAPEAIPA